MYVLEIHTDKTVKNHASVKIMLFATQLMEVVIVQQQQDGLELSVIDHVQMAPMEYSVHPHVKRATIMVLVIM